MCEPLATYKGTEIDFDIERTERGWRARFWLVNFPDISDAYNLRDVFESRDEARTAALQSARSEIGKRSVRALFESGAMVEVNQ